jgi:hypothetical protein
MFHRKVPVRDANGNIVKWYGSSLDIEERKTAEEQLRRNARSCKEASFLGQNFKIARTSRSSFCIFAVSIQDRNVHLAERESL